MMNARLNKALVALLAVTAVGACDDPPVDPGNTDAARLSTNPSFVVIEAGETRLVQAFLVNDLGNPVVGDVDFEACNNLITVAEDPNQTDIEPGTNFNVTGVTLGESCVNVEASGFEETIQVRVVPAAVSLVAAPDTVRAGDSGSIDVTLVDASGAVVGPFDETQAEFSSSNEDALFFTDSAGTFDTEEAGAAIVTIEFESFGVTRELEVGITVLPGLPTEGEILDELGALLAGDTVSSEVQLFDSIGNVNNVAADIDSVVAVSSDEDVAVAWTEITEDPDAEGRVIMTVFAEGTGGGQADITVTAYTVNGAIDMGSSTVTVVEPVNIIAVLPADAEAGEEVVITGTGLEQTGSETLVFVEGQDVTETYVTAITPTAITLTMPGAGAAATYEIEVDVGGGATTDAIDYSFGGEVDEPENDEETAASLPIDHTGWMGGSDMFDVYAFDATATETLDLFLDWDQDKDLDVWVQDPDGEIICESYFDHPEETTCDVVAGTTYHLVIMDYDLFASDDETFTEYHITLD